MSFGFICGLLNIDFRRKCVMPLVGWSRILFSMFSNLSLKIRSIHQKGFCKKSVLKNFANFTGKHQCSWLFLIQLQAIVIKNRPQNRWFPAKFAKFLDRLFWRKYANGCSWKCCFCIKFLFTFGDFDFLSTY